MFREAFGGDDPVTAENFAKAVASFERTLITPGSAYDRWVKGDRKAMTAQQVRGLKRFRELGCAGCHTGPHFGAQAGAPFQKFPVFANSPYVKRYGLDKDLGRYEVTKKDDIVAFLEALTGPFPTIEAPRLPVPKGRAVAFD